MISTSLLVKLVIKCNSKPLLFRYQVAVIKYYATLAEIRIERFPTFFSALKFDDSTCLNSLVATILLYHPYILHLRKKYLCNL